MARTSMYYLVGNDKTLFQIRGFVSCKWQAGNLTSKPITHHPKQKCPGISNRRRGLFQQDLVTISNAGFDRFHENMIWKQNNSLFSFPSISWVVAFWTFSRRLALFCCCVAANWNHCSLRVHKVACFYGWRRWVSRGIRPSIQSSYGSILGAGGERGDIYLGLANKGHHHRHLPFLLR